VWDTCSLYGCVLCSLLLFGMLFVFNDFVSSVFWCVNRFLNKLEEKKKKKLMQSKREQKLEVMNFMKKLKKVNNFSSLFFSFT
jgi:hypothetical protein